MRVLVCAIALFLQGATSLFAINVALGRPVTASQPMPTFNYVCGAGTSGSQPGLSTITDGVFQNQFACYQEGPYWFEGFTPGLTLDIDLEGTYWLSGAIVQVDNNDVFQLQYRDTSGIYHDWWLIDGPNTFGFETRPNVLDTTEIQSLAIVEATGLRIFGVVDAPGTDNVWSVAEVQAFAAPEPSSLLLMGSALAAVALIRRRRRG